jgi:signal peptidase I
MTTLDERIASLRAGLESSIRPTAPVQRSTRRPAGRIVVACAAAVAAIAVGFAAIGQRNSKPDQIHVSEPSEAADGTYVVPSPAMEPAYQVGQRIKVTHKFDNLERGDVVLFRSAEADGLVLKRVIGLPGETVAIVDGRVAIDGRVIDEPWLATGTTTQPGGRRTTLLSADEYFLLGDNRANSNDSRFTGPIKRSLIEAKVTNAVTDSTSLPPASTAPASTVSVSATTVSPRSATTIPGSRMIVDDVGRFAYHSISAFGSIWILGKSSGTVTRIDPVTGAIQARIQLDGPPFSSSLNRLAASSDSVYVSSDPITRIDPTTNTASTIAGVPSAAAVVADGPILWVAGPGAVHRIEPDGTVTALDVPRQLWMDLAVSNGLVWALAQASGNSRVLALDTVTGLVKYDIPIATNVAGYAVRLVADDNSVVVGVDTSGGGGRTGALQIIDARTGAIGTWLALASRPEGIVLTPDRIITSGAVIDRTTMTVIATGNYGFTLTQGPDGSIWGTISAPGSDNDRAQRFPPGQPA